jgi:hypothetical protein
MPDSVSQLSCSFCGTSQRQAGKLIAGLPASSAEPYRVDAFICDGCVARAHAVRAVGV